VQPGRGVAVFCTVTGALMFAAWTMLLAAGQVSGVRENAVAFSFHWTAEFLTAILLVGAGLFILRSRILARPLYYFATGMLFIAALGAAVYYSTVEPSPAFVVVLGIILTFGVVLAWRNRVSARDYLFFLLGTVLYAELNVTGVALQAEQQSIAVYTLIALTVTLPGVVLSFRYFGE